MHLSSYQSILVLRSCCVSFNHATDTRPSSGHFLTFLLSGRRAKALIGTRYKSQYRDPSDMGIVSPTRIQVELLEPDLAFGILSWTIKFPNNPLASEVVGTSTMNLQKFDNGWKIVVMHMSFTEM